MAKSRIRNISISNERGLLSVDFLFGIIISFVIMLLLLRVSFSLMIAEVAQYIAFSVARAHSVGDVDVEAQRISAKSKFNELAQNPAWRNLFKDTFELGIKGKFDENTMLKSGENYGGAFTQYVFNPNRDGSDLSGVPFIGVRIPLKLKWMNMSVLFLGRTSDPDATFQTNVTGFLLREPAQSECLKFMEDRYESIIQLDPQRFNNPSIQNGRGSYLKVEDNGC